MPAYEVIFPEKRIVVEANDPQEAANAAAYELARQCEQGLTAQVTRAADEASLRREV